MNLHPSYIGVEPAMHSSSTTGGSLKRALKAVARFTALTMTAPLALPERLLRHLRGDDVLFEGQSQLMALLPGKTGMFLRAAYYHWTLRECPLDVAIQFGAVFAHSDVVLGHRVYIGVRCSLGRVVIGDDTMLADHVQVLSGRHQHGMSGTGSFQSQERHFETVAVGANCWLGAACVVMAEVGAGSVIGAGSVVTRPIPPGSVAVGSPARVVRRTEPADGPDGGTDSPEPPARPASGIDSPAVISVDCEIHLQGEQHDSASA